MKELRKIYLVSCVAGKMSSPTEAGRLYTSPWFLMARGLVKKTDQPWFILSAKYGLVSPDTVIPPYEQTLNNMGVVDRRAWANRVQKQMDEMLPDADEVVVLAGVRYRENLMTYLRCRFPRVSIPMEGLQIGRQLSWMKNAEAI